MKGKKKLLAFCGLYCGDCLGHTGIVADSAQNFKNVLEKYKFDRTAKILFPKELKHYDRFFKMLCFMTNLKCPKVCRERADHEVSCQIRKCCKDREFYACYECSDFESCQKLKSFMNGLHANSCIKNLQSIKEVGLDHWLHSSKRYWHWDE